MPVSNHNPAAVPGKKGKRIFKRLPCQIPVHIDGEFQTWSGFCYDISAHGLSLELSGEFMREQQYVVHLTPDPETTVRVKVNERFRRSDPDGVKLGVHVPDPDAGFLGLFQQLEQRILKDSFDPERTDFTRPFWLRESVVSHLADESSLSADDGPAGGMRQIGEFQVLAKLGAGMIGTSFKVRNPRGEIVVLKVVHPHYLKRVGAADAWLGYLRKVRDLHHDFVTPIHEVDLLPDKTNVYYIMPYYSGGSLGFHAGKMHTAGTVLHHSYVLRWMDQLARGLAFLHEKGIAHCNLKPENLFLNRRGELEICDPALPYQFLDERGRKHVLSLSPPAFVSPVVREGLGSEGPVPRPYAGDIYGFAGLVEYFLTGVRFGSEDRPLGGAELDDAARRFLARCRENPPVGMSRGADLLLAFRGAFAALITPPAVVSAEATENTDDPFGNGDLPGVGNDEWIDLSPNTSEEDPFSSDLSIPLSTPHEPAAASTKAEPALALEPILGPSPIPLTDTDSGDDAHLRFKLALRSAWAGGAISKADRNRLAELREELGLPTHEALHLEEAVMFEPAIKAAREEVLQQKREARRVRDESAGAVDPLKTRKGLSQAPIPGGWLRDALFFPFRANTPFVLSLTPFVMAYLVISLLSAGMIPSLLLLLIGGGLTYSWIQNIIVTTSEGERNPPAYRVNNVSRHLVRPYVHLALLFVVIIFPTAMIMSLGVPNQTMTALPEASTPLGTEAADNVPGYGELVDTDHLEPEAEGILRQNNKPGFASRLLPALKTPWFWMGLLLMGLFLPPLVLVSAFTQEFGHFDPRFWGPALRARAKPYLMVWAAIMASGLSGVFFLWFCLDSFEDFGLIAFAPMAGFIMLMQARMLGTFQLRQSISF